MGDAVCVAETLEEAKELQRQLIEILKSAGMELHKICRNHSELSQIAKTQVLFPVRQWRHVLSNQNPADLISRGVDPDKLLNQGLWRNGPEFLSGSDYPSKTVKITENNDPYNSELKKQCSRKSWEGSAGT
ncbi:hypothetical protein TNCV_1562291 [Trichonephila clavipes]|nr:hypothetical protein TNCV_1562291 [Trichonephila clavipes]